MQKVSSDYVESMKGIQRNHGYIKVTLGIVNSEAQENLTVDESSKLAYFSDHKIRQSSAVTQPYATNEQNWSKVDGTMYFLPSEVSGATFYDNGLVSRDLFGAIKFDFGGNSYDVAGFTIDFGDNYPVDFSISNGIDTLNFTENESRYFTTDRGMRNISTLTISASSMVGGNDRLRIYSLAMGVSNTFTNDDTVDYTETTYVSPIADSLPSTDVSVTVENYNQYYNPDNPNSVMTFFELGQEVRTQFGYDTHDDGNIEWLPETVTHLKSWQATDSTATFTATDSFDTYQDIYYRGKYYEDGISLYDLAVDVFQDAGIDDYKIDKVLQDVIVYNPIPAVPHTQALQIIANAGRCTLRQERNGRIYIQSTFIPRVGVESNGETDYSNVFNILNDTDKIACAICSQDFSLLTDTNLRFMGDFDEETLGFVSEEISDEDGYFSTNPTITYEFESDFAPFGYYIRFRNVAPKSFRVTTYRDNEVVDNFVVDDPTVEYDYEHEFGEFTVMTVEFTQGAPNSRITIDKATFSSPTDYTIERYMMRSTPTTIRQDRVKSVTMSVFNYLESSDNIKTLSAPIITDAKEQTYKFHTTNPSYGYEVSVIDGVADVEIVDSSAYEITVELSNVETTQVKLNIQGYEYKVDEQYLSVIHDNIGIDKSWSNPLISDAEHAQLIEDWISDFVVADVEYEVDWRGDPRIDADDLLFLELKTGEYVNIRNYQNTIYFSGAWSGNIRARKILSQYKRLPDKPIPVPIPTVEPFFTYDGELHYAITSPYDENVILAIGTTQAIDVGDYTITFVLRDKTRYVWTTGNTDDVVVNWSIGVMTVPIPVITSDLTYNGSEQSPTISDYDHNLVMITGITGTNAGTYTATISLIDKENYTWTDGTTEDKTVEWIIKKANGWIILSKNSVSLDETADTDTVNITSASGNVFSSSQSEDIGVTVTITNMVITITSTEHHAGTDVITITVAETQNYTSASAVINVTATFVEYDEFEVCANIVTYSRTNGINPAFRSNVVLQTPFEYESVEMNYDSTVSGNVGYLENKFFAGIATGETSASYTTKGLVGFYGKHNGSMVQSSIEYPISVVNGQTASSDTVRLEKEGYSDLVLYSLNAPTTNMVKKYICYGWFSFKVKVKRGNHISFQLQLNNEGYSTLGEQSKCVVNVYPLQTRTYSIDYYGNPRAYNGDSYKSRYSTDGGRVVVADFNDTIVPSDNAKRIEGTTTKTISNIGEAIVLSLGANQTTSTNVSCFNGVLNITINT